MSFTLRFTLQAEEDLESLKANNALLKRLKAVYKALKYLETNP